MPITSVAVMAATTSASRSASEAGTAPEASWTPRSSQGRSRVASSQQPSSHTQRNRLAMKSFMAVPKTKVMLTSPSEAG